MGMRSARFRVQSVLPKKQVKNQGIALPVPPSVTTAFTQGVVMTGVEIESLGCEFINPHVGRVFYKDEEYIINFQPIR